MKWPVDILRVSSVKNDISAISLNFLAYGVALFFYTLAHGYGNGFSFNSLAALLIIVFLLLASKAILTPKRQIWRNILMFSGFIAVCNLAGLLANIWGVLVPLLYDFPIPKIWPLLWFMLTTNVCVNILRLLLKPSTKALFK